MSCRFLFLFIRADSIFDREYDVIEEKNNPGPFLLLFCVTNHSTKTSVAGNNFIMHMVSVG